MKRPKESLAFLLVFTPNLSPNVTDMGSFCKTSFIYLCMDVANPFSVLLHVLSNDDFKSIGIFEVCTVFFSRVGLI